ncbi:DUF99 family protein [Ferroplasma sp.]|uniref:endonuclease dU n=1 Tax=Ferroplasma sp. TaxID=2591003 RepID=UPI00307DACF6
MKSGLRILGIDDGPFNKDSDKTTVLVGVLMRLNSYVEGISIETINVDGTDATQKILSMASGRFMEEIDFIMSNGVTFGGFNIMDVNSIHETTGIPVISITRKEPDLDSMFSALKLHFPDYKERTEILKKNSVNKIEYEGKTLYINCSGININDAAHLIKKTTIMGNIPEPVRMAHLIATAIINGESHGKT